MELSNEGSMRSAGIERIPLPGPVDKIKRAIWNFTSALIYRPSPVYLFGWRCLVLRVFGATLATGARPYPNARIWAPWNLTMEAASCLGPEVECYNPGRILVRCGATVSQRAFLCTASHDPHDRSFALMVGQIEIGPGAWVAAEAFIGPGVTVGRDSIVGARAVVIHDVGVNLIVAGNPSRIVGIRYADGPVDTPELP